MLGLFLVLFVMGNAFMAIFQVGHILAAKAVGVRVDRLHVGIGPEVANVQIGETRLILGLLPLGSYARMGGVDDEMLAWVNNAHWEPGPRDLGGKHPLARALVFLGGSLSLFVSALLLYCALSLLQGVPSPATTRIGRVQADLLPSGAEALATVAPGARVVSVGDRTTEDWGEVQSGLLQAPPGPLRIELVDPAETVEVRIPADEEARVRLVRAVDWWMDAEVGEVSPGSPAERAGIKPGDRILAVGESPVEDWWGFVGQIRGRPGELVGVSLIREGRNQTIAVTLGSAEQEQPDGSAVSVGTIGIYPPIPTMSYRDVSIGEGVATAFRETVGVTGMTLGYLLDLVTGQVPLSAMGGAVYAAQQEATALRGGLPVIIRYQALGLVNYAILALCVPFPPMPGGYLLFLFAGFARRKRVSVTARLNWTWLGVLLLGGLSLFLQTAHLFK